MKPVSRWIGMWMYWVPFVFVSFLWWMTSRPGAVQYPWMFNLFLPMAFLFIGVLFVALADRIVRIETALGERARAAGEPAPKLGPEDLFEDPEEWSRKGVGTWPRFVFMVAFLIACIVYSVYSAATDGWRAAIAPALFASMFVLMFLYAVRRMLKAKSP